MTRSQPFVDTAALDRATAGLPTPLVAVDLDAFDANAADLTRRAAGRPIRVASKSVRCRSLLRRVLDRPGFAGVMAYAVREAVWLARHGFTDVFVAYPSTDVEAIRAIAADDELRAEITLAVDSVEHVAFLTEAVGPAPGLRVALDVDCSVRLGRLHLGVRRSPLRTPDDAVAVTRAALDAGLRVAGVMFYDAQVAGLPDRGPHLRRLKKRTLTELAERRAPLVTAVRALTDLDFVNGGGTGSVGKLATAVTLTELAAGSGLYGPTLFDGYDDFSPHAAMAFALPVVRRPADGIVTAYGGGYVASGEPGWSRVPTPVTAALRLIRTEGTGEVQTPLRGDRADVLRLGDRVWMRGAKAGELLERFDEIHLVSGGRLVETVPTYRGEGRNFG
ncbi:D-serine deaminase-like pyridoxal phosphate-dependent protein [Knoellia remsis]|uniref:D-serine deaminase-like pyridoxal phosphate-dependent protein n=1 Tax=Knoellia remsis TaxID=407159 RepID=A0A2T0U143_9MICO|nr:amino acid deaminase/aldolase [Knoellia remsis]PRY51613.1 D-serine deaminase-like pyridoxal phosphate-dependent protein [Knoellia remsis]